MKRVLGKHPILTLIGILALLVFPMVINGFESGNYVLLLVNYAVIYVITVSGLDILIGYTGQVSLGHVGFFAIGAYGTSLLNSELGIPTLLSTLISCVIAIGIAALVAWPAAKLKFHFLSLATIAFGWIIYYVLSASPNQITGNYRGYFPEDFNIFGFAFDTYFKYYYLLIAVCAVGLIIKQNLIKSRTGRGFIAIRENATAANGMGINVRKYKILAFCVSAAYASMAGSLYAHMTNYICPSLFTFDQSVMFLTMLLLGGGGTFWGPITGAVLVQLLNELLRSFQRYSTFIYGIVMLLVILFMPGGIVKLKFWGMKLKPWLNEIGRKISRKEVRSDVED